MKFRTYGMVLGLLFALGLVFSFGIDASGSHDDDTRIVAEKVDPTSEDDVKAFLEHIIDYYNQQRDLSDEQTALTRNLTVYGRDIRLEGDYKNSDNNMYSMGINERGIVTNHAGHPALFGYRFNPDATDSSVASTVQALIHNSSTDTLKCEPYRYKDLDRVACAKEVESPSGNVTTIAGLHHELEDPAFELPDCSGLTLDTTAKDVFNDPTDANLEAYVQSVIGFIQMQISALTTDIATELSGGDLTKLSDPSFLMMVGTEVNKRNYDKIACYGTGDFKHENIYIFIMDADPADGSTVLFNGNNSALNGTNLELDDDELSGDDKSIDGLFARKLRSPAVGNNAYVNYRWDDPSNPDDNVDDFLEDGKVPGTSCKRSYIEVADIYANLPPNPTGETVEVLYIFGSGTYPGDEVCASGDGDGDGDSGGDDGACAIAGTGNTSQSALLNLFMIASVLFSVVFLGRRI